MATSEEMELARAIRRMFAKKPIDSTRLEIQCIRGRVYLSGNITGTRDQAGVTVKGEVGDLVLQISRMAGVKQLINECKMVEPKPKEAPDHGAPGHGTHSGHR
jgi:hypothetical protein